MLQQILLFIRKNWQIVVIISILSFILSYNLGKPQLLDWDECVYVQQAKEMTATENFLTNQWNSQILLEKPPLSTWIISIFFSFAENEFMARFAMIITSMFLLFVLYYFISKLFSQRAALISIFLLTSTSFFIIYSTRANSDVVFTFFLIAGFFVWWYGVKLNTKKYVYISGLLLGLAVLAKGLSIMPYLGVLFLSCFLNPSKERFLHYLRMLFGFALVIIPWHLYQFVVFGKEFWQVYFVEHLFRRASVALDFHNEGRLFYIRHILQNFSIWLTFGFILPFIYLSTIKKYHTIQSIRNELKDKEVLISIFLAIIIPLFAIIQVKTRIWWYVLPIFPFIAVFLAYSIDIFLSIVRYRFFVYIVFILLLISASYNLYRQSDMFRTSDITLRNRTFMKASTYPEKEIHYLVWFAERQGRESLPENMHTSTTFVFGGNPCARYYSGKKVHYYYSIEKFQKVMQHNKGLYIIENGDMDKLKVIPMLYLYWNSDFTIARRI